MSERPLCVRVADALGWSHIDDVLGRGLWRGIPPGVAFDEDENGDYPFQPIPKHHDDWRITGPLIEAYKFMIWPRANEWAAMPRDQKFTPATGETPLVAVCNLILALKEAGKLR